MPSLSVLLATSYELLQGYWIAIGLFLVLMACTLKRYFDALALIDNFPGVRTIFGGELLINRLLCPIRGILLGSDFPWLSKYSCYVDFGWDIFSSISLIPSGGTILWLADPKAISTVLSSSDRFPKPTYLYSVLEVFGPNIVSSEHSQWKKFRKITAPAFSERNNRLVWNSSISTMNSIIRKHWGKKPEITVDHAGDLTFQIAVSILASAGFGHVIHIGEKHDDPDTASPTTMFSAALHIVAKDLWLKLVMPQWAFCLTPRLRRLQWSFRYLEKYMLALIHERRTSARHNIHQGSDLFGLLLEANEEQIWNSVPHLSDSELLGNLFVFLLGGHEANAQTLCFALALLALYPEEQDLLFEHVHDTLPSNCNPSYSNLSSLSRCTAVLYETLRMFPPVNSIPKICVEDTILSTSNGQDETRNVLVPKGAMLVVHTVGLHYNPRYWTDPTRFRPSRFLDEAWPRDAFMPFGSGPRACIGRKFFEAESVAVLAMIIRDYQIKIKDEPQFISETFEERRDRLLQASNNLTLSANRVPLTFVRRTQ